MTHAKALQAGHSSQGTSEPITPARRGTTRSTGKIEMGARPRLQHLHSHTQPRWLSGLMRSRVHSLWLLVDHCVLRNWDRILVRAVKGLISRAGMVSICPLLWQRDVKLQQTNKHSRTPPRPADRATPTLQVYYQQEVWRDSRDSVAPQDRSGPAPPTLGLIYQLSSRTGPVGDAWAVLCMKPQNVSGWGDTPRQKIST